MQNPEITMDIFNDANNKIWFDNEIERLAIINVMTQDSVKSGQFWK